MQVKINIKPENEAKFIQALNDSNIPYWIEENKQAVTQDVTNDEEAADEYFGWKNPATIGTLRERHAAVYNAFIAGRQSLSTNKP